MSDIIKEMHQALYGQDLIPLAQEGFRADCPVHGTTWDSPRKGWCPKCRSGADDNSIGGGRR